MTCLAGQPPLRPDDPLRRRGGILVSLLVLLVVAGAGLVLGWMLFLPAVAANQVERRTGFGVALQRLFANPFTGEVDLGGLVVRNPPDFGPADFLQVQRLRIDAQLFTLAARQPVIDEVVLDLPVVVVVTRPDGTTNVQQFREAWRAAPPVEAGPVEEVRPLIRRLHLRVGEIRFVTLGSGAPRVRSLRLGWDSTYHDVTSWKQLMVPDLLRRARAGGGDFEGLLPEDLGQALGGWSRRAAGSWEEPGRRAVEALKSLFEKLEETAKP